MTNREKYAKEILDIACTGSAIGLKDGKPFACSVGCSTCEFFGHRGGCKKGVEEWSNSEYVEPPVDWSKVPVDTKVLVRDNNEQPWKKYHFAKYKNGRVFTWVEGKTSWTVFTDCSWNYAKLADKE